MFNAAATGGKEKRTYKKNMDGRSTSSRDKKFRTMEKQRRMVFGFRKMATAVIKPDSLLGATIIPHPKKGQGHP
jgi:hypothetical protein